jgi:GTPase SAR1 family protein
LQLWDTAGQERFRKSMVAHYYRNVSAVIFVYDVTQKSSFDDLTHWIEVRIDFVFVFGNLSKTRK